MPAPISAQFQPASASNTHKITAHNQVTGGIRLKKELRVGVAQRQVAFGQDCKAIIPVPAIDGAFLALAIKARTNRILGMVDEAGHGTGRLPTDLISRLEIIVPSTRTEQLRIVEILESLDDQIRRTSRALRKINSIRTAMVRSMLGGLPATSTLGDILITHPKNGIYKPLSEYGNSGTCIVRIDSIQQGQIRSARSLARVQISNSERRIFGLALGDVLVNRVNSIEYIGKSALVRSESEPMVFESNIMRCRINENRARPAFVALWLSTPEAMRYIRGCAKHAIAQASINQRDLNHARFHWWTRTIRIRSSGGWRK